MPPFSSQSSSASSPTLKRKQQTISSFFAKKTPATRKPPSGNVDVSQGTNRKEQGTLEREDGKPRNGEGSSDVEDEEDIVAPAPKRVRTNGFPSGNASTSRSSPAEYSAQFTNAPPASSSERTEQFRFAGVSASERTEGQDEQETAQRRKEREKLHQRFVKKLGGSDCLIGIGSKNDHNLDGEMDAAEGDEDEEATAAAQPLPIKGKGKSATGKKGGSKLTPMEKQVIEIKRKHMDTVLVVEVGYKFRFFGEDARIAAKELSIVCIPGKLRFDERMGGSFCEVCVYTYMCCCANGFMHLILDPSEAHLDRFASASIPVHRLHVHVKRLVAAGHKVGVVRQIETAALKAAGDNRNAPFVRKLTNLYTKGTYIDDVEGLEGVTPAASGGASPATGYMLCITETNAKGWGNDEKVHVGIVAVQPATGDVIYDDFEDGFMRSEIETRLLHIAPCEFLIVGDLSKATEKLIQHLSGSKTNIFGDKVRVERTPKSKTAAAESHSHVSSFYAGKMKATSTAEDVQASNLLQKVLNLPEQVTICLSAMIGHMTEYGLEHVFELTKYFQPFSARSHMLLNGNTLVSLEIYQNQTDHTAKGSLFWTLDRTQTRFGQRLLRKWVGRPLLDKARLEERIEAVAELKSPERMALVERIRRLLCRVKSDLEKSLIRIYYGKVL